MKIHVDYEIADGVFGCRFVFRRFFYIVLYGKHIIMLYAKSQGFYCSFGLEGLILFLLVVCDILIDIFDEGSSNFLIHSGIIFVFIEGKYIVDVFDK
jgi:hypothetical protein